MIARALPYVDPQATHGLVYRVYVRLVGTRVAGLLSRIFVWKLDPYVLRLTRGRLGLGLVLPPALLETRGARTGRRRLNGVIYFHYGQRAMIGAPQPGL